MWQNSLYLVLFRKLMLIYIFVRGVILLKSVFMRYMRTDQTSLNKFNQVRNNIAFNWTNFPSHKLLPYIEENLVFSNYIPDSWPGSTIDIHFLELDFSLPIYYVTYLFLNRMNFTGHLFPNCFVSFKFSFSCLFYFIFT